MASPKRSAPSEMLSKLAPPEEMVRWCENNIAVSRGNRIPPPKGQLNAVNISTQFHNRILCRLGKPSMLASIIVKSTERDVMTYSEKKLKTLLEATMGTEKEAAIVAIAKEGAGVSAAKEHLRLLRLVDPTITERTLQGINTEEDAPTIEAELAMYDHARNYKAL